MCGLHPHARVDSRLSSTKSLRHRLTTRFAEDVAARQLDEDGYFNREDGGSTPDQRPGKYDLGGRQSKDKEGLTPLIARGGVMRHSHKQISKLERLGVRHQSLEPAGACSCGKV